MKPISHNLQRRRAGFTLIELLVVLVIAAVLAAVTLGGYSAMRSSNARTSCQANMAQIYRAMRLYTADYNGNAPYYDPEDHLGQGAGIGLWALYGFANGSDELSDVDVEPERRYLTNPKVFHCPADRGNTDDIDNDQLYEDDSHSIYNQRFLSYQVSDSGCQDPSDSTCSGAYTGGEQSTYNPIRKVTYIGLVDNEWQHQLLHYVSKSATHLEIGLELRPPTDDTIVFWCPFHRNRNGGGEDNVLFWDGSVRSIPVEQDGAVGWERQPEF